MNHVSGWLIAVLGDATPSPSPTGNEPDASMVSPGWLGFVFLMFLCITVFVIWKSMNRQFKKIDFDEAATERPRKVKSAPTSPVDPSPASASQPSAELGPETTSDANADDAPASPSE